jgi:hypothetical protein
LDVFFAFALQYFEYAAIFAVVSDLAEGRDAHGAGAQRDRVLGIGVPLEFESLLQRARKQVAPLLGRAELGGLDEDLARDLARPDAHTKKVIIVPLVVRGRAVALLWGDDGGQDVRLDGIGDVIGFAAQAGNALERVLLERKLGRKLVVKPAPVPPASDDRYCRCPTVAAGAAS